MYLAISGSGVNSRCMANERARRRDAGSNWRQSTQAPADDTIHPAPTLGARSADCCSAAPAVQVMLSTRLESGRPAELLLCGHHYRANSLALAQTGAAIFDRDGRVLTSDRLFPSVA